MPHIKQRPLVVASVWWAKSFQKNAEQRCCRDGLAGVNGQLEYDTSEVRTHAVELRKQNVFLCSLFRLE